MIGRLRGLLLEKTPGRVLIEASGIGYEVDIPYTTFFGLPEVGQEAVLHTHLTVREDAHLLFGFGSRTDRDLFRLLIKTTGVGPKLAVALLSGLDADEFVQCVERDDVKALTKVPGVGRKTAERLLIEMRDRIGQLEAPVRNMTGPAKKPAVMEKDPVAEAESALVALGYRPQEAARAVNAVAEPGMASEAIIRMALKGMLRE